jgi:hypothetical protein
MEGNLEELMDGVAKVVQQIELEEAIAMDNDDGNSAVMQSHA